MTDKKDWSEWYDMTRVQTPSQLLVDSLSYINMPGNAIDVGGGALKDTKYLLQKGFDVTVIDSSPLLQKEVADIKSEQLHPIVSSFEDFQFPIDEYILASAMHSLSYCDPKHFNRVFTNIKASLKKGGIFCGQMYDAYDQWSKSLTRAYQSYDEARNYLKDFEILYFQEEETEQGHTKHWRIFNFIAKKL